jgi:uncharacterized protein (TIGR00730 family)
MPRLTRVCVYAGSSPGADPGFARAAADLARLLAGRGIGIVYGGASVGLMGVVADAALDAGAEVVGVLPRRLQDREIGHPGLSELRVVETMHERKALMAELADAFVALPGGLGTLEEVVEVLTWTQLGLHDKPVALLSVGGYFAPLEALLDEAVRQHFLRPEHRELLLSHAQPEPLLDALEAWEPRYVPKWLDRETPPAA